MHRGVPFRVSTLADSETAIRLASSAVDPACVSAEAQHKLGRLSSAALNGDGAGQEGNRRSVSEARIYDNTSVAWQDRRTGRSRAACS
jgi:hypothetical protein